MVSAGSFRKEKKIHPSILASQQVPCQAALPVTLRLASPGTAVPAVWAALTASGRQHQHHLTPVYGPTTGSLADDVNSTVT